MSRLSADVKLKKKPKTGNEAYEILVDSLEKEIKEKQEILLELTSDEVKCKFIKSWNQKTKSVIIRD